MKEDKPAKDVVSKGDSKESPDGQAKTSAPVTPSETEPAAETVKAGSDKSGTGVGPVEKTPLSAEGTGSGTELEEEESRVEDMMASVASAASGWLSGWMKSLEVAKDKSVEVYDMVKKDLSEFGEAVQAETSTMLSETGSVLSSTLSETGNVLSSTSQTLKESLQFQDESSAAGQVKKSVSGFLTHVHKAFTPDTAQDDDTEAYVLQDGQPVMLDRLQTSLYRLASDPDTFLTDPPESDRVRYEVWSADLDLEARQTELSDLLASNRTVLEQYTQLVPARVSHVLFWHRYLFRVHLAEEREKQREELKKRAELMTSPGQAEKQITWEEEDFSHHVEVTDAQADQLLAEYDAEQRSLKEDGKDGVKGAGEEGRSGSQSPERASSNEDDWVKADIDTETNSSVGNDWEKWD